MGRMAPTLPTSRPDKTTSVLYLALAGITAAAAALLVPRTLAWTESSLWADPQTDEQFLASWRVSGVLLYTCGSGIGHICALVAGMLAASGLRGAVVAGAGLGVVGLTAAFLRAHPRMADLAGDPGPLFMTIPLAPDGW